jgi:hypothetical protein
VRLNSVSRVSSRFPLTVGKLWRDTFIGVACRGLFNVLNVKCVKINVSLYMYQTTYLTKRSPRGTRSVGKLRTPVSTTTAILSLLLPQGYSILINIYGKPCLSHRTPRYSILYHLVPLGYK